jgi:hypothetical protein
MGPESVHGHAIALELRRDSPHRLASFSQSLSDGPAGMEVASEGTSLAQMLSRPRDWPGPIAFRDPERTEKSRLWIRAVKV